MFGSNFAQQFGLLGPPWDNLDAYGGLFGQNAPVTPLIGSEQMGEQKPGPSAQPPVAGTPGVAPPQQPQGPPIVSGNFTPETFESTTYQPRPDQESAGGPAQALSPGPLAPAAGLTTEFAKR